MTTSALVFALANLGIVGGYAFAAGLILLRKGPAEHMSHPAWFAGLAFFVLCGATHGTMAWAALTGDEVIHDMQHPSSWMLTVHVPQALSIWVFLWAMNIHARNGVPLEGRATVRDEDDPPA